MKREREDWTRLYHKTLKRIKAMIDIQRMMKDMKKIAEETNMTVMEIEETILTASTNNQNNKCYEYYSDGRKLSISDSKQHRQ